MSRDEYINALVQFELDTFDPADYADMLRNGFVGFANMTDDELREAYNVIQ